MAKVGVLALQGAARAHVEVLTDLGADAVEVRSAPALDAVDGLVIPGGESTTISMLLSSSGLFEPLAARLAEGLPVLGTCAGMILLASEVLDGRPDQRCFGAVDIAVRRNAFGRQVDSFEAPLAVDGLAGGDFPAVFIRAPYVERVGAGVSVLASVSAPSGGEGQQSHAVLCRQGAVLVAAFHPELSGDLRIHQLFLRSV
jgi:pyridoxal 5'-phosphate synthase pdxT subunit